MNGMKRAAALAAAAALALSLAACGAKDATPEVEAALAKLREAVSFRAVQVTEREETVTRDEGELTLSGVSQLEIVLFTAPEPQIKATTTASILSSNGESREQSTVIYVLKEGDGYSQYLTDGSMWVKSTQADAALLDDMSAGDIVSLFLSEGLTYAKAGTETLDSGSAVRYETRRTGADMVQALDDAGLLSSIAGMSEDQQTRIRTDLEKLKGLTVSVWVDEATGYPVQFEMDLSGILAEVTASISESLGGYSEDDGWVQTQNCLRMTVSDYNSAPAIVLPPEAADAQVIG